LQPEAALSSPSIPAPPREVRAAAAFGRHAPIGVAGISSLLATAVLLLVQVGSGAGAPFEDWALDSGAAITTGDIVGLAPSEERPGVSRLTFRYRVGGREYEQHCHVPAGREIVGLQHRIEFLANEPGISRIGGATRAVPPPLSWRLLVTLGGAGVLALLLWLRLAVAQRRLLRDGRLVVADVVATRPIKWLLPRQLAVEFRYRDLADRLHHGRQWCRARSALGQALQSGQDRVAVVHDEGRPEASALATPDRFAATDRDRGLASGGAATTALGSVR